MLTESPRVIFCGESPRTNCRRVEVDGSRVKLVWSGCGGGPAFFCRAVPGPKLSDMVLVGSRAEIVWSGLGAGPMFLCPDHECRERALTVPRRTGTKKGRSPRKRPNIIILSHPKFNVNYPASKRDEFSLLYHLFGSYLCEIPS